MKFLLNNDQDLHRAAIHEFARKEIEPCADHIDHGGVLPDSLLIDCIDPVAVAPVYPSIQ